VQALRDVDFSLEPGIIHAPLGENGAGKTTLMHVLYGLIRADAGTIEVGGAPSNRDRRASQMAAGIAWCTSTFRRCPA